MTALTARELQRLLDTTRRERWYPLWVLLSTTGLRIGEALALTWDDVNLEARRLLVVRSLQRQRGVGLVFAEPKTLPARRYASIGAVSKVKGTSMLGTT